jgi:TonB family protein
MKSLFFIAISFLAANSGFAQKQNVYFLKNSGKLVNIRDSADYIRIVREPDSASNLYNVFEFYLSGKQKMLGKSSKIFPSILEGVSISYFENGNRKEVSEYKNGYLVNEQYLFYPNGKAYITLKYPAAPKMQATDVRPPALIISAYDSTGKAAVTDSNGYYKGYNENFTRIVEEGPIKNGKRHSEWKGYEDRIHASFTETYVDGELVKGISVFDKNDTVQYTKARVVQPYYQSGLDKFYRFLGMSIRYPDNARRNGTQGRVLLGFVVEKDGALSNIEIMQSAGKDLDAESIRVLTQSRGWQPGTVCGRKVKVFYTVPVIYTIQQ